MNRYQKIIKYTKPLAEIDEKIRHLNERMTTTGMYTVTNQDDGEGEQLPPVFEPPPLKESKLREKSASRFFKKEKKVDTSRTRWIKG
jgi:hypothetical protein